MPATRTLLDMCTVISLNGLHRGEQFAQQDTGSQIQRLDICALAYVVAEHITPLNTPDVFFTDEPAASDLIESSEQAMAAIRAISAALDSDVNETDGQPDYIEHVSTWAMTPPLGCTQPPTNFEVIGRLLRAADRAARHAA